MASPAEIAVDIESKIGYNFIDRNFLLEALKAAGSGMNIPRRPTGADGNKRLAFVGQKVMEIAILDDWYHSEASRAEGSQRTTLAESQHQLTLCGQRLGLDNYISTNFSQGSEPPTPAIIARTVQALFGAVWFDSQRSVDTVKQLIQNLNL